MAYANVADWNNMPLYRWLLTALFLAVVAAPLSTGLAPLFEARAQVPLTETVDEPEPAIDPVVDGSDDLAIADRLRGIFREIEGLEGVAVTVDAGVVRLSGPIADTASAERAKA
ncbi:hypothetical protein C8024_19625, partial [Sphingopyxis sp. BSNA05]|nr:hypothetical protein [Sphingopyxis sp. BSNA05]